MIILLVAAALAAAPTVLWARLSGVTDMDGLTRGIPGEFQKIRRRRRKREVFAL